MKLIVTKILSDTSNLEKYEQLGTFHFDGATSDSEFVRFGRALVAAFANVPIDKYVELAIEQGIDKDVLDKINGHTTGT